MEFNKICTIIDLINLLVLYFLYCYFKWRKNRYELFVKSCLYIYIIGVLYFTCLIPFFISIPGINVNISLSNINLVPYIDYLNLRGNYLLEIILNVLMLIPFGILYPFIYNKSLKKTILIGLLFSVCIEILQLLSVRQFSSCDITDVINNTFGVLIGYFIYKILNKPISNLLHKLLYKKNKKRCKINNFVKTIILIFMILQLIIRSIMVMYV